jgi:hypothetical protein
VRKTQMEGQHFVATIGFKTLYCIAKQKAAIMATVGVRHGSELAFGPDRRSRPADADQPGVRVRSDVTRRRGPLGLHSGTAMDPIIPAGVR